MRHPTGRTLRAVLRSLALLALAAPCATAQTTWHVDDDAASGGDGLSWATAFATIERAFFQALPGDRVWVAVGTYRPIVRTDPGEPRSVTFLVPQAVRMYGGFEGTELSLDERAGRFRDTILTADIGVPGDPADNAFHVVSVVNPSGIPPGPTWIDGFTLRDGNATGPVGFGGGVYSWNSATVVRNCIVTQNSAFQGAAFHAQPGSLRILRCTVTDNHALDKGGVLWGHVLNVRAVHSTFARNTADAKGGAIFLHSMAGAGAAQFIDCVFHDNSADVGGAVFLGGGQYSSGAATFLGCTFAFNQATSKGGGLSAVTGTTIPADGRLYDCIVWRNRAPEDAQLSGDHTVEHCDVMGGAPGPGNIAQDPRFADAAARDFRLLPGSPCIDAGDNAYVPADSFDVDGDGDTAEPLPWDLARCPRFVDDPATPDTGSGVAPLVDMGAFEHQP